MTYSSGSLIQASDYNTFTTTSGGLNDIWATGSGDKGWGQSAFTAASTGGTVTATQWAQLVNNLATSGSQTGTTLTSRTAPTAGTTIGILSALSTDISSVTTNRGFAVGAGTEYGTFSGTTSKTTATGSGQSAWTITFTHTVTFPSADQARYFWNAGGRVRLQMGKSSTGTDHDDDWNAFANGQGSMFISGRVNSAAQTIAGTSYTGFTRIGATAPGFVVTNVTTTGWYQLTTSPTTLYYTLMNTSPYQGETITVTATATSSTVLTLVTTWTANGSGGAGTSSNISGGTATTSPSTTITGTAPTVLATYIPPATTYLTNSWGTPSIAASVA